MQEEAFLQEGGGFAAEFVNIFFVQVNRNFLSYISPDCVARQHALSSRYVHVLIDHY